MEFHVSFPDAPDLAPEVFTAEVVRVGTGEANDVVVDAERFPMVSRIHAELVADDRGAWLYDNESRTGTWLEGERVEKARLAEQTVVTIGEQGLRMQIRVKEAGPRTRMIRRADARLGVTTIRRLVRQELEASPEAPPAAIGATRAIRRVVREQSRTFRVCACVTLLFLLTVFVAIGVKVLRAEQRLGLTERELRKTEEVLGHERDRFAERLKRQRQQIDRQAADADRKVKAAAVKQQALHKQLLVELAALDAKRQREELALRRRLMALRQRHDGQSKEMRALKKSMKVVHSRVSDPFARLMARQAQAIFIIGIRSDDGRLVALGTGFAVRSDGVLATNAHVTESVMEMVDKYRKQGRTMQPVAVMNNRPERIYRIIHSAVHPEWEKGKAATKDVSLLRLDTRGARLPAVLPVATREQLRKLQVGQAVALIGFPGEVNDPYSPIATFKRGDIGRITTLDKERGTFEQEVLVQHSAPTTPGNSGSPILDRDGRVVAIHNSGIAIRLFVQYRRVRFRPATGISWGLRADVILDMLEKH